MHLATGRVVQLHRKRQIAQRHIVKPGMGRVHVHMVSGGAAGISMAAILFFPFIHNMVRCHFECTRRNEKGLKRQKKKNNMWEIHLELKELDFATFQFF